MTIRLPEVYFYRLPRELQQMLTAYSAAVIQAQGGYFTFTIDDGRLDELAPEMERASRLLAGTDVPAAPRRSGKAGA